MKCNPKNQGIKKLLILTFSIFFIMGLSGCNDDEAPPAVTFRKVKGDPYAFVKNSRMNGQTSSLPAQAFDGGKSKDWRLYFSAYVEEAPVDYNQMLQSQDPSERGEASRADASKYSLEPQDGGFILKPKEGEFFELTFARSPEGGFRVSGLSVGGKLFEAPDYSISVLHYSWAAKREAFSLLIRLTGAENAIVRFNFIRDDGADLFANFKRKLNYNFIFGNNRRIAWDVNEPLVLSVCGLNQAQPDLIDMNREAADAWSRALQGRLEIVVNPVAECPPFSDLNSHNFWIVDDWIEIVGERGVVGAASAVPQLSQGKIIDADIFLLRSEMLEGTSGDPDQILRRVTANSEGYRYVYKTVIHEMGHLLGLDHTDNPDQEGLKSVMSYNSSRDKAILYDYDFGAIQELYSHQKKENEPVRPKRRADIDGAVELE